jgi:MYXO-CTERM domain-containing protein
MKVRTVYFLLLFTELVGTAGFGAPLNTNLDSTRQALTSAGSAVEPSPWLMLLGGLGLLWMLMRFRRHRTD